MLKEVKSKNSF